MKRNGGFILSLGTVVAALLSPGPVAAGDASVIAGRPIGGVYDPNVFGENCQGIVYGRVDDDFVLFVAHHCRHVGADDPGDAVFGPNGQQIGTWGPWGVGDAHDLSYIKINASSTPTTANRIYRGPSDGILSTYWTITASPTEAASSCDGNDLMSHTVYQNAQGENGSLSTNWQTRAGFTNGYHVGPTGSGTTRNCTVKVGLTVRFNQFVESSSPFTRGSGNSGTLVGSATGQYTCGATSCITMTPIWNGLFALDQYWANHGDHAGAWICTSASCP